MWDGICCVSVSYCSSIETKLVYWGYLRKEKEGGIMLLEIMVNNISGSGGISMKLYLFTVDFNATSYN